MEQTKQVEGKQTYYLDLETKTVYFHTVGENTVIYQDKAHSVPKAKVEEFVAIAKAMGMKAGRI